MTLSTELLAMIADVPAATDEQMEQWSKTLNEFELSLIARIVVERKARTEAEGAVKFYENHVD